MSRSIFAMRFKEQGWDDAHGIPNTLANAAGGVMPINAGPLTLLLLWGVRRFLFVMSLLNGE